MSKVLEPTSQVELVKHCTRVLACTGGMPAKQYNYIHYATTTQTTIILIACSY